MSTEAGQWRRRTIHVLILLRFVEERERCVAGVGGFQERGVQQASLIESDGAH